MDETSWIPCFVTAILALIGRCDGGCVSDAWVERNGWCYLFQVSPETHAAAELTCADMGATLASISDSDEAYFVKSAHPSRDFITTVWSKYLLFRDGYDVMVTDKFDNVTDCVGCNSLKSSMINQNLSLSCIVIGGITETSSNWNLADCYANHLGVCELKAEADRGLEYKDIAAIICLAFLVVSFVVVITIDLIKNPVPDDSRQLIEDARA